MGFWDCIIVGFRVSLILAFLSFLLRPFLPDWYNDFTEIVGSRIFKIIVGAPQFIKDLWIFFSTIAYSLGMFSIIVLLIIGIILFGYTVSLEFGCSSAVLQIVYDRLVLISQNKAAWAGATIIITTTVAIGHMWNLRLNIKKFDKEMIKHFREEREAIEKRKKEQFDNLYFDTQQ
ncbi:MAG: hypothetical protein V6Z89_17505 [Desulfobacter sp.]